MKGSSTHHDGPYGLPGQPVANDYGLLSVNHWLLWSMVGIVACQFRQLGFQCAGLCQLHQTETHMLS